MESLKETLVEIDNELSEVVDKRKVDIEVLLRNALNNDRKPVSGKPVSKGGYDLGYGGWQGYLGVLSFEDAMPLLSLKVKVETNVNTGLVKVSVLDRSEKGLAGYVKRKTGKEFVVAANHPSHKAMNTQPNYPDKYFSGFSFKMDKEEAGDNKMVAEAILSHPKAAMFFNQIVMMVALASAFIDEHEK